jgi:hypothetical protein
MYGLSFNTKGIDKDDILTIIARELINIDNNKNMFDEDRPYLFAEKTQGGEIVHYIKHIVIYVFCDIMEFKLLRFMINKRIYEIINEYLPELIKNTVITTDKQHIKKITRKTITLLDPLKRLEFTIHRKRDIDEIINAKNYTFIIHNYDWHEDVVYFNNINEILPSLIYIDVDLDYYKKLNVINKKIHPWLLYETEDKIIKEDRTYKFRNLDITKEIENKCIFEKALIMVHGAYAILYNCGSNIEDICYIVDTNIKFEDAIDKYIKMYLHPYYINIADNDDDNIHILKECILNPDKKINIIKDLKNLKKDTINIFVRCDTANYNKHARAPIPINNGGIINNNDDDDDDDDDNNNN